MSETSSEKPADSQDAGRSEDRKVPIAAVAKERAEKRAAREEATELRGELEKAKSVGNIDPEFLQQLTDSIAAEAKKALEERLAPIEKEREKYKVAATLGLNEQQADVVMSIRSANPNLTDQQALLLARVENREMFPAHSQPTMSRPAFGGVPVGGNSEARSMGQADDFVGQMKAAEAKGDRMAAQHFAQQECLSRFRKAFLNLRPQL